MNSEPWFVGAVPQVPLVLGNTVYSLVGHNGAEMALEVWNRNTTSGAWNRNFACHASADNNCVTVFYHHLALGVGSSTRNSTGIMEFWADLGEEWSIRGIQATANYWETNWVVRARAPNNGAAIDIHKDGGSFKIRKNVANDSAGGVAQTRGYADWAGGMTDLFEITPDGIMSFGAYTPIGAETVTGYIMAKDIATGTMRKLAVVS